MHICKDHVQTTPAVASRMQMGKKLFMTVWLLSFFSSKTHCLRKYCRQITYKWYKKCSCLCSFIKWLSRESFQSSKQLLILHWVKMNIFYKMSSKNFFIWSYVCGLNLEQIGNKIFAVLWQCVVRKQKHLSL